MFDEPFDNSIKIDEGLASKVATILEIYNTKLTSHLERVEKK